MPIDETQHIWMKKSPEAIGGLPYYPQITGLRALAVLAVVAYHAFPDVVRGGYVGVDVFFVISGFLISRIILNDLRKSAFSFQSFYAHRIRRIFPALIFVLWACYVFGWFALLPDEYRQLGKHISAGAGFVSNFVLWDESGYFDNAALTKPLLHLWSLGIEEQFYFFWPPLLVVLVKARKSIRDAALLVVAISFVMNLWELNYNDPDAAFYLPFSRLWQLASGGVLAYASLQGSNAIAKVRSHVWLGNAAALIGISLITSAIFFFGSGQAYPGWRAIVPTAGALLVIASGPDSNANRTLLSNRFMIWIGLISYPLYLWHWPILSFSRIAGAGFPPASMRLVEVGLAISLAWLTYVFIEKPIRLQRVSRSGSVLPLCLSMCLVGSIGFYTFLRDGLPSRMAGYIEKASAFDWPQKNNASMECKKKYGVGQYCNIVDINRPPTAALIGDSHANHFFPGLSEFYKKAGGNLVNFGRGACPPFFGIDRGMKMTIEKFSCYRNTKKYYDFVLNSVSIKTVFLAFHRGEYFREEVPFVDIEGGIDNRDAWKNAHDALIRTIRSLSAKGKKVIVIRDVPDLAIDPKDCYLSRPFAVLRREPPACADNLQRVDGEFGLYEMLLRAVSSETEAKIFDTGSYLPGNFPVLPSGVSAYRDTTHLSTQGSLFFADKFGEIR